MRIVACAVMLLGALSARAQVDPNEAAQRLAEKEKQRLAERSLSVTLSAGDLADLKARIKQLEGENASLRARLGEKESPKKFHEMIEIGMTRDEVMAFIKRRGNLKIVGQSADAGVRKSSEEVVVKRAASGKKDVTVDRDSNGVSASGPQGSQSTPQEKEEHNSARTRTKAAEDDSSKTQIERVTSFGRRETIRVARYGSQRRQTGTHQDGLTGQTYTDYETVQVVQATMSITLTDDVVTSVDAQQ